MTAVGHRPPVFETDVPTSARNSVRRCPKRCSDQIRCDAALRAPGRPGHLARARDPARLQNRDRRRPGAPASEEPRGGRDHADAADGRRTRADRTHPRLSGEPGWHLSTSRRSGRRTRPGGHVPTTDLDESDRKIIDIVRETGQVNGRLARSILDVEAATASRIISGLVDRGVLVKTSTAQRGPSVTYGRGPRFSTTRSGGASQRRT